LGRYLGYLQQQDHPQFLPSAAATALKQSLAAALAEECTQAEISRSSGLSWLGGDAQSAWGVQGGGFYQQAVAQVQLHSFVRSQLDCLRHKVAAGRGK
jgi:hypothetical protein